MMPTSGEANGHVPQSSSPATGGAGMFAELQATTRLLLEVQYSQQRLVERFLETQERMLLHCLTGGAAVPASASLSAPAAVASQPATLSVPAVSVPSVAPPSALGAAGRVAPAAAVARPPVAIPAVPQVAAPQPAMPAPAAAVPAAATPRAAVSAVAAPAPVAVPAAANGHAHGTNGSANGSAATSHAGANGQAKSAAPAAAVATDGPPSVEQFRADLLAIVSERTGYPTDMLDVELPLEAGLGIDSIKTVEIFSNLKAYHAYFADEGQDEEERLTEFTKLKTLGDIINAYARRHQAFVSGGGAPAASASSVASNAPSGNGAAASVDRYSLSAVEAPLDGNGAKKNFQSVT